MIRDGGVAGRMLSVACSNGALGLASFRSSVAKLSALGVDFPRDSLLARMRKSWSFSPMMPKRGRHIDSLGNDAGQKRTSLRTA
jgi:hypothetical protein